MSITAIELKEIKKQKWYSELKDHIMVVHASSGHYKTILITSPQLYLVVTRVNNLVIRLWVAAVNERLVTNPHPKLEPIRRIGWLVNQKQYRRYVDKLLSEHE